MPAERPSFLYTPLETGEIRLLYASIDEAGEVVWSLKSSQLLDGSNNSVPEFDALSYAWGDLDLAYQFVCNDQELQIHHNLYEALPYLARRRSSLPLWIDAICINQQDEVEKRTQIKLMSKIYRCADTVWAWIGIHDVAGLAFLDEIAQVGAKLAEHEGQSDLSSASFSMSQPAEYGLPSLSSPLWEKARLILCSSWLSRLWVIQEAVLARQLTFLSGLVEVSTHTFQSALYGWRLMRIILTEVVEGETPPQALARAGEQAVFVLREHLNQGREEGGFDWPFPLLATLRMTARTHKCSDPYDRVRGITGLVDESFIERLGVLEDRTIEEGYTRFTYAILTNSIPGVFWWWIFSSATAPGKRAGFPSWVPEYSRLHEDDIGGYHNISLFTYGAHHDIRASRRTSVPEQIGNFGTFVVKGLLFDRIQEVFPELPHREEWIMNPDPRQLFQDIDRHLATMYNWERDMASRVFGPSCLPSEQFARDAGDSPPRHITADAYWSTLTSGHKSAPSAPSVEDFYAFRASMDRVAQKVVWATRSDVDNLHDERERQGLANQEGPTSSEDPGVVFTWRISLTFGCRRLFTTVGGRIGYGPLTMEVGDAVCVLNNAIVPHVLRKIDSSPRESAYTLVGEAYVYDMMDGEVEGLGLEEQDFWLE
ncbi:heterokaryon incompatibility protein-domain-containing protein [Microdochium trichocladiopsis]|uniref:Heterokaryon incompatibility protein-domain-containing protein n=1 Tax=Microdochium trichocladiopsis TaxID=1682393 RepID=A0A9P8XVB5_9PEZI|nr:heterokaryon incompatibility protein-domain-containing protein [Microdochium trichocladiopsis]KAH7014457.1 heterokaryon incompatibility protein-domain-containing protein [Microdochium trichocladiopsis]